VGRENDSPSYSPVTSPLVTSSLPAPLVLPPRLVAWRQVVVAVSQSCGPVDELPDDIRVAGMPISLGDHVYQDPVQRHLVPVVRPPRHMAECVQRQRVDRRVRVRPRPLVQPNDLLARLIGGSPHVRVGFGVVLGLLPSVMPDPRSPSGWKNGSGLAPRQAPCRCQRHCAADDPGRPRRSAPEAGGVVSTCEEDTCVAISSDCCSRKQVWTVIRRPRCTH